MTKLLELFRSGMDTLQISQHLGGDVAGWPESRVNNELYRERREERPAPVVPLRTTAGLIRYAGYDRAAAMAGGGR